MGKKLSEDKLPKIFSVNWFRTDDKGNFIWPGFGENLRIIDWILNRCEEKVGATDSSIGLLPQIDDLNMSDLKLSKEDLKELLKVDKALWQDEIKEIETFYDKFGKALPIELINELETLKENLKS